MADTRPNIVVSKSVATDIYEATVSHPQGAISVGTKISVKMIGNGNGKMFSGSTLTGEPTDDTGYRPITAGEDLANDSGDSGAWIWSREGCVINVEVA